jgi:hypothetical protein
MPRKLSPEEAAALGLPAPAPRKLSPEEAASLGLPAPASVPRAEPAPVTREKTSVGDTVGRAAAQGASVGIGDEAAGALDYLYEAGRRTKNNVERAVDTGNPGELFVNPVEEGKHLLDTYRGTRDRERELNRRAAEDHPVAYGVTNVVTGIPAAIATGGASRAAPLVSGAVQGLTYSEAELTPDKVTPEDLVNANISMGMGAGMNKASAAFPNASKVVLPVVGGTQAAFGDKIGMSDADRVAAGTSAGLGVVSLGAEKLGNSLQKKATGFGQKAEAPKTQLADDISTKDLAEDTSAIRKNEVAKKRAINEVRREENKTFKVEQKEANRTKALAGLDTAEENALAQRDHNEAKGALKEYNTRSKDANKKYMEQIGAWDDELRAIQTARARRGAELAKLEAALAALDEQQTGLDASAQGARASAFKEAATRLQQYEDIVEEPLPAEFLPIKDKVKKSYKDNSSRVIVDPDESEANFRALKQYELDQARAKAQAELEKFKSAPYDEEQAVKDLLKKKGSRVSKNEAYQLAQKLGLNPRDFETFEVIPPKGGFKLVDPAPDAPEPIPSAVDRRLENIANRREALNAPALEPTRRPEGEILEARGLDSFSPPSASKPPVQQRVNEIVERAVPDARARVADSALKWAGGGAGVGLAGMVAGQPGLSVASPVIGGALGARHAVKTLTSIDPYTGKFKDPAGAAGVYTALERAFNAVPNLAKKYGAGWQRGMSPLQIVFYIQNDPELARALDTVEPAEP